MPDLTTLTAVKSYAGIAQSDTSRDAMLASLLTAASSAVENYCDRVFSQESLVEYFDGKDNWINGYLHLKRMPVTSISRIASEPIQVLAIKNESASVQLATISVNATGVILSSMASATANNVTLTFAAYPTLSTLATAMSAAGFAAVVTGGYEQWPSNYLRIPQGALNCKVGGLTNGACLFAYTRELSVSRIDYEEGTIWGFFPVGFQQAEVRYTAGYATIPSEVQTATCAVAKAMMDHAKTDAALNGEKLGDYSWQRRNLPPSIDDPTFADAASMLAKYRRIRCL